MSGSTILRLSLREFTEIFAGLGTLKGSAQKLPEEPNHVQSIVLSNLMEGRLPEAIEIIKTDEDENDDWVEIRFGEIDPAIAPLR